MKWFCAILFFSFVASSAWLVQAAGNDDDGSAKSARTTPAFFQEDECSSAGGMCIESSGCPPERLSKGSCPKQKDAGAVCCHSLSSSETICAKLGGSCRESCPETLIIGRADDCDEGLKCCPLV